MALRLEIECFCEEHQFRCQCKPIREAKVTSEDVKYNLIRCNPALAKYFNSSTVKSETVVSTSVYNRHSSPLSNNYQNITDEKGLRILLSNQDMNGQNTSGQKSKEKRSPGPCQDFTQQTSPKNNANNSADFRGKNKKSKTRKDSKEEAIRNHYKELKKGSRYLSDTGFRKYFNRQCFENYGRQNTHTKGDGIIYGNYMKTHNINPHTGANQPHDEQTFYNALVAASPQKFVDTRVSQDELKKTIQNKTGLSRIQEKITQEDCKPIHKHHNDRQLIAEDNLFHSKVVNKYRKLRVASPSPKNTDPQPINRVVLSPREKLKSPKAAISPKNAIDNMGQQGRVLQYQLKNQKKQETLHQKQRLGKEAHRHRNQENLGQQKLSIEELSEIKNYQRAKQECQYGDSEQRCPVDLIYQQNKQEILSKDCHRSGVIVDQRNSQNGQKKYSPELMIHKESQSYACQKPRNLQCSDEFWDDD